jgi:hypothetical protein
MSRVITFTEESAKKAVESLRAPIQLPYKRWLSSKLLMHQIKREMHGLQYELTGKVLRGLQRDFKTKSKDSWATSFCVILSLCMCMEAVQVAVDGIVVQRIWERKRTNGVLLSRGDGFEIARQLDDLLFKDCIEIFHMIYRSKKGRKDRCFNPIRDGIDLATERDIDEDTVRLVNDIRQVIIDHRKGHRSYKSVVNANVIIR